MIPIVWLVTVIAFFMSRAVPGDPVDALLQLRGITPDQQTGEHNDEYVRIYEKEGYNLPLFYFSVLPHFHPVNIHATSDKTRRHAVQALLKQKYQYTAIERLLDAKAVFTDKSNNLLNDSVAANSNQRDSVKYLVDGLRFKFNPVEILHTLDEIQKKYPVKDSLEGRALYESASNLLNHKVGFYYPVIHWHGFSNQYHQWLSRAVRLDFGKSVRDGLPVSQKINQALKWTLILVILNLLVSLLISIPVGIYSGRHANGLFDKTTSFLSLVFYSMPVFWLASLLITYFTTSEYGMKIFPITSMYSKSGGSFFHVVIHNAAFLILPVLCLVLNDIAYLSKLVRSNYMKERGSIYAVFALAKGLTPLQVDRRHIFNNILIPLITVIAGAIPSALAGSLVIEVIFNIPGMGRLMHGSIFGNDWNVVFGILIILSVITVISLAAGDWLYQKFNPKIKASE
jgi:peptide/nickel transport system permease protein